VGFKPAPIPEHRRNRILAHVVADGVRLSAECQRQLDQPRTLTRVDAFWHAALRELKAEELITEDDYEALILRGAQ